MIPIPGIPLFYEENWDSLGSRRHDRLMGNIEGVVPALLLVISCPAMVSSSACYYEQGPHQYWSNSPYPLETFQSRDAHAMVNTGHNMSNYHGEQPSEPVTDDFHQEIN